MPIQYARLFLYKPFVFLLFLFAAQGFSQIGFSYKLVGSAAKSAYSDGTPYTTSGAGAQQVVQLKGKVPLSGERIMLYPFIQVKDANGEFICQVDRSNVPALNAITGIMVRESIESGKNYCFLGFDGNMNVLFEQCLNSTVSKMTTTQLPAGTKTYFFKVSIAGGVVRFYIAPQNFANISDWLTLGLPISIPSNALIGPFLIPGSNSTYDITKFTNLQNNLNGTQITNSSGVIAITDVNLNQLVLTIVTNHSRWVAADPTYANLFKQLANYYSNAKEFSIDDADSEVTKISKASCNAELYIADIIYHSILAGPNGTPSFAYNPAQYNLYYNLNIDDYLYIVQSCVSNCDQAATIDWKDALEVTFCGAGCELAYKGGQLADCIWATGVAYSDENKIYKADLNTHDRILLHSADYITNLAILSLLSKTYRTNYLNKALQFSGKLKDIMGIAHNLYQNNNIPIHAYSAITLLELVQGTKATLSTLNPMLDGEFTSSGGYGEGTAYLNEVLSDLMPLYYFGLQTGTLKTTDLKQSALNSGQWLMNISDFASGSIPAVDDAYEITPWLAPFAYLNNDTRYLDYTNKYYTPIYTQGTGWGFPAANDFFIAGVTRRFLTYPATMAQTAPTPLNNPDVSFNDGVGKIHFKEGSADVNVSIIAENGQDLTAGNSHDQQDNGSITVNRTTSPSQIDRLVIDPGYAGFASRWATSLYALHNTVLINGSGVNQNPQFSDNDLKTIVKNALNVSSPVVLDAMWMFVSSALMGDSASAKDKSAGTDSAFSLYQFSNGHRIMQYFNVQSTSGKNDYNIRNVINYDGEIIVVDNLYSKKNNYGLHWNLPPNTARVGGNTNILAGSTGNSQIRLSIFSQDQKNLVTSLSAFPVNYPSEIFPNTGVNVDTVIVTNSGSGSLYNNDCFNFLSVIETKDASVNLTGLPTYANSPNANAAVCISKTIPSTGMTRYIFVNNWLNNKKNTITINGVSTDAMFGIMDFKTGTNALDNILAYGYFSIVNNGTTISSSTENKYEFKLKTVLSNQTINTNTTINATNAAEISNVTVNPPTSLNVTGSKSVVILPVTVIKNGSTAVVKVTP